MEEKDGMNLSKENYSAFLKEYNELRKQVYLKETATAEVASLMQTLDLEQVQAFQQKTAPARQSAAEKIEAMHQEIMLFEASLEEEQKQLEQSIIEAQKAIAAAQKLITKTTKQIEKNRTFQREIAQQLRYDTMDLATGRIVFGPLKVGDTIQFGAYPQKKADQREPIEWLVLEVKDGKALLLSKYILDHHRYDKNVPNVTWETSLLHNWLNNDFSHAAFTWQEWNAIAPNGTEREVFLLSGDEVRKYFKNKRDCAARETPYAHENSIYKGVDGIEDYSYNFWWLRHDAIDVRYQIVYTNGNFERMRDSEKQGVRPAIWINLE